MIMSPHLLRESTQTSTDQLSDVLRLVQVHSVVSGGFSVGGAWTTNGYGGRGRVGTDSGHAVGTSGVWARMRYDGSAFLQAPPTRAFRP